MNSELEWVLVPKDVEFGPREFREAWKDMVAGGPVIPDDVWEQMVERGARVAFEVQNHYDGWLEISEISRQFRRRDFSRVLRAALGLPETQKDPAP
jgi:hypothetical protein